MRLTEDAIRLRKVEAELAKEWQQRLTMQQKPCGVNRSIRG
jgi:hypothetical protein